MLRLLDRPDAAAPEGWTTVNTPLGALAHVNIHSPAHELCEDWRLLASGRMHFLDRGNFAHYFGSLCTRSPKGLVAELLMSNGMRPQYVALITAEAKARSHVLNLIPHCFGLDTEETDLLTEAVEIARSVEARLHARAAAAEAFNGR